MTSLQLSAEKTKGKIKMVVTRDFVNSDTSVVKYQCGQVIDIDFENNKTYVQLIENSNQYIVAIGVHHHKAISNVGIVGYFVELNKFGNDWYIVSQSKDLEDIAEHNKIAHRFNEAKKRKDAIIEAKNGIEICFGKESGIDTFSRSKKRWKNGYAKHIKNINSHQKNGYGLIGDFISLTESKKTRLYENELYLDCTRSETNYKDDIYHLFTIKDSKVCLLAKGNSIKEIWNDIESFISQKEKTSLHTLFSCVTDFTQDKSVLKEFAQYLKEYCDGYSSVTSVDDFIEKQMMREIHHPPIEEMIDVTKTNKGTYYD